MHKRYTCLVRWVHENNRTHRAFTTRINTPTILTANVLLDTDALRAHPFDRRLHTRTLSLLATGHGSNIRVRLILLWCQLSSIRQVAKYNAAPYDWAMQRWAAQRATVVPQHYGIRSAWAWKVSSRLRISGESPESERDVHGNLKILGAGWDGKIFTGIHGKNSRELNRMRKKNSSEAIGKWPCATAFSAFAPRYRAHYGLGVLPLFACGCAFVSIGVYVCVCLSVCLPICLSVSVCSAIAFPANFTRKPSD